MTRSLVGVVLVLHGLVHLLYAGHSLGFFELQAGLRWPEGSWAVSKLCEDEAARSLAGSRVLGLVSVAGRTWSDVVPWSYRVG